ncbi:LamG-like jellyroll fold domain-containing protein [Maribellus maritimus]|uniref:LamG-like jellyroll fold domain-containing protein n=1 Tax=Maribellus maritimus TaxID=2870838 RepID=UPI001EEBD0F0|nr:LamG-like jellyroll fold domain-containing protein [Maribellus maritimus]MCG6189072.1 right-handed parallel beta-helix repeat-containing protein [Maribellus maritimus]
MNLFVIILLSMSMVFSNLGSTFLMLKGERLILIKKFIYIFPILFFLVVSTASSYATVYYVSNSGNDNNSGTSPTEAWQTLKKVNSFYPGPGDQILFKRGNSWVGTLKAGGSGSSGNPVVYGAYGSGENPKIYNSEKVTNWEIHSGNIYKAKVSADKIEQVFINDNLRLRSARYPNNGYFDISSVNAANKFTSKDLNGGINYGGAMAVIRDKEWSISSKNVSGSSSQTITLASAPLYGLGVGKGFVLVGKLEFLDEAGEWYYDKNSGTLYLWTPNNDSPENYTIRASTKDYAVYIDGRFYVNIENLNLLHSNTDAVYVSKSLHITINNNNILYPDNRGMTINSIASSHVTISNNMINGANHDGLKVDGTYHTISDNTIKNIRLFENFGIGGLGDPMAGRGISIIGGYSQIQYNHIENIGYNGIGFFDAPYTKIEYNYIKNTCLTTQDGGGIYCYNRSVLAPGCQYSEIRGNIVDNVPGNIDGCTTTLKQGAGIYMDDRIHHIIIENNTVARASYYAIYLHNNRYITVSNNTIFDNGSGFRVTGSFGATQNSIQNNTFLNISSSGSGKKATLGLINSSESSIVKINSNKYIDKHRDTPFANTKDYTYKTFSQWRSISGGDSNSTIDSKPLSAGEAEKLIYNNTKQEKTINLGNTVYLDSDGNQVTGKITLKPFTSKILIGTNIENIDTNREPEINGQSFEIKDELPAEGVVGQVLANDPDENQNLTFSIEGGNNENLFYIESSTGRIYSTKDISVAQDKTIELIVTATDDGTNPLSASAVVMIYILATKSDETGLILDVNPPSITSFTVQESINTLSIPVLTFEATDDNGVAGYLITETGLKPSATDSAWLSSAPDTFLASSAETSILYAWTKDQAGNISNSYSTQVEIDLNRSFSEYLFEEESGPLVYDSQGPNDGTIYNKETRTEGIIGSGLKLDGSNYINLGECFAEKIEDQITLSAWIKPDPKFFGYQGIIMHGGSDFDTYAIYINQTFKRIAFKTTETSEPWLAIDKTDELWDGEWHNITAVYNGTEKIIYLDNIVIGRSVNEGNISAGEGYNLLIGAGRDTEKPTLLYKGLIDEVRIYNYALTIEQISELFNKPQQPLISSSAYTIESITICEGDNYLGWTETGTYEQILTTLLGTDSIITTELIVNPNYEITEEVTIQKGESYLGWTEEGEYLRTLSSVTGCDSIVTTLLTVESYTENSTDDSTATENTSNKSLTFNSDYNFNNVQTEDYRSNENLSSIKINPSSDFIIYPNPTTGSFINIDYGFPPDSNALLEIIDSNGVVQISQLIVNKLTRINLENLTPGLYFVVSKTNYGTNTKKLMIK